MRSGIWSPVAAAVIGTFLLQAPLSAQESTGWKFPNLNPFRSKSEPDRGMGELSDSPPRTGWKFPTLPKPSMPRFVRRDQPSMSPPQTGPALNAAQANPGPRFQPLKKINQGARGLFASARNTVTRPFTRNESDRPPTAVPSERSGPRGSFFRRAPEAETQQPEEIRTAQDFLKLPRVE